MRVRIWLIPVLFEGVRLSSHTLQVLRIPEKFNTAKGLKTKGGTK